jgi:Zn-dependent protease with chaperone function
MRIGKSPSPTGRIFMAVGLWAGFYLMSFGLVAGLLYFAYALFDRAVFVKHPGDGFLLSLILAGGSVVAAWIIFVSCLPRWHRFKPPGPLLDPNVHPALFEEIRQVAKASRQKPPDDVYLTLEVNAWVLDRRRYFLFPRRVLAIGLPLLQVMTVSQLRSVIAHEFGHFAGGDTKLAPWVYRTHAAIERTLSALEGRDSIWRFPFMAYARLFLGISLEVSRRQELLADELAARIAGVRACGEALKRTHRAGAAFPAYAGEDLIPLLDAGHRPPIAEGFAKFMEAPDASRALAQRMSQELAARPDHRGDSHPPLPLRLEALRGFAPGPEPKSDPPALGLLQNLDEMESQMLVTVFGISSQKIPPKITWEEAAEKGHLPAWREAVKECAKHLVGVTPASFPDLDLTKLGHRVVHFINDVQARGAAARAIGVAMLVALKDRGWTLTAGPGERAAAIRGDVRIEPFHIFLDLAEGKLTRAGWKAKCDAGEIGDMNLGFAVTPPQEA